MANRRVALPAADQASQADPAVSESRIPKVEHVRRMGKSKAIELQKALEQRLASAEGAQTPKAAVEIANVLKAVQRRIGQLDQSTAQRQRTKWENAVAEKRANVEELQKEVRELSQKGSLLKGEAEQLAAQEEGLVVVLERLVEEGRGLQEAGEGLQVTETLLSDVQANALKEDNDDEKSQLAQENLTYEALLADLNRRHTENVEKIKAKAANARRVLRLRVAYEAQDLTTKKDVHGRSEVTHAQKVEKATGYQAELVQQRAALETQQRANQEAFETARNALGQAEKDITALLNEQPPVPAPVVEDIDPDVTLAPEADGLEAQRRKEEMVDLTLTLDITLETVPRRLDQLAKGLNLARSSMHNASYLTENSQARLFAMKEFKMVLGEKGHTKTLKTLNENILEAERKVGELDPKVLGQKEAKRYQDEVKKLKEKLEEEAVFLDALTGWLESQNGPVPQRRGTPATPPTAEAAPRSAATATIGFAAAPATAPAAVPAAPPTQFSGLTLEAQNLVDALMDQASEVLARQGTTEDRSGSDGVVDADASLLDLDATGDGLLAAPAGRVDDATTSSPGAPLPQARSADPWSDAWSADSSDSIPTERRLPILTPDQVKKIKDGLNSKEWREWEAAIETLDGTTPSPEWVEILTLAGQSTDAYVRRRVPYYASKLATFLSSDRDLNDAGLNFFREFPNAADHTVANRAAEFLPDLALVAHFNLRVVVNIVTLYLKKRPDEQEKERIFLNLTGDLIRKINDIYSDARTAKRAPSYEDGHTIQCIREFLYHLFETVLASSAREDYPETVITAILDTLEADPYCLERKAVCDLPLRNEERIKIMTGRTINIVNGLKERIAAGVGIEEIRAEFGGKAFVLEEEMVWFIGWGEERTDAEVKARATLINAITLLDERLEGTAPSIELADIDQLLATVEASSSPEEAPAEAELDEDELKTILEMYLEGNNRFPKADRILTAIAQKVVSDKEVSAKEKQEFQDVADFLSRAQQWLQKEKAKKGQIKNTGVLDLMERALAKWKELNETAEELQAILFPTS